MNEAAAHRLADDCAARARALADARPDGERLQMIAGDCERRAGQGRAYAATFIAAVAAERAGGPKGRAAVRSAQAGWFEELLA